jgi:hypothetical protein
MIASSMVRWNGENRIEDEIFGGVVDIKKARTARKEDRWGGVMITGGVATGSRNILKKRQCLV